MLYNLELCSGFLHFKTETILSNTEGWEPRPCHIDPTGTKEWEKEKILHAVPLQCVIIMCNV